MKNRKTYVVILMAGVALSAIVHSKYRNDLASDLATFRHEQAIDTVLVKRDIENTVAAMYQGLRTIARLPGVRAINRYPVFHQGADSNEGSSEFEEDARRTVQELYNNLATNVAMSEVYIVPVDLEPDKIDPHTGKLQEPITTFDELIIGRHADEDEDGTDEQVELEEIEIYEYRLMKRQLTWMRDNVPTIESISGLDYPAIGGPKVVTCDNSRYSPSHPDDLDRSGLVYSVPFFGPDGKLKGCISGVLLTHVFRDILPTGDYAILNPTYGGFIDSEQSGQSKASTEYARAGVPDPELLYSEVRSLNIMDRGGDWILWAGKPNAAYWNRSDVQNARQAVIAAHAGSWILSIGLCTLTFLISRNKSLLLSRNLELEQRVSERTRQQAELTHANRQLARAEEKAVAATEAKSEFLANMSHEIRTPMTAILGFAENMLGADQSESEKLNCVHTIRRNGKYLLCIINDILDLSKIEAGKMTIERIACQPCRIVAEVASLMRVRADAKGLPFNIEYVGPIPETIHSDATRLRQILINLIGNAIKFTETGSVRLVTRFVDDGNEPFLQFDVIDTGRGMTKNQNAKLFHAFMQADASTTREFGGTGLGLTISKRFAAMLGGDITVAATEMGVGSTFRVTVATGPLDGVKMLDDPTSATVVANDTIAVAQAPRSDLQGCRILLAEDGPDNQRLISFFLKKAGADTTAVENGKLALDAALAARDQGNPFDVILMDMQMPVMDGYEATGQLRRKGYTGSIIALTANAMASDREKCIDAGCDEYATKPIDRKKLIATIEAHLHTATA